MSNRLKHLLRDHLHFQIPRDYAGTEVYHLPEISAYLKIGEIDRNSNLRWERDVLHWLCGKVTVPSVLDFDLSGNVEAILISEIFGKTASDKLELLDRKGDVERFAEMIAAGIRLLHDLPIADCYLDQRLDKKFKKAEENLIGGFVDEADFDADNLGKTGRQIFDELVAARPADEDLVFTHGDLCPPNIIIRENELAGYIDFDRGGVADRYQDIALFCRSFGKNSRTAINIEPVFCRGYGVDHLDSEKLDFYRKLDELF